MTLFGTHIDHPWVFALLPVALVFFAVVKFVLRKRSTIPYPPLQYKRGPRLPKIVYALMTACEVLLIVCAFIALAGPYKSYELVSIEEKGIDVLVVADISLSMQATDFTPNRLEAMKKIIASFAKKSGGNRVGIVVFSGRIFSLAPLTTDHEILSHLVDGISIDMIDHRDSGGTAIGDAMLYAADMLDAAKVKDRAQVMILLSDGETNVGLDTPLAAKFAASKGIKIHTIGVGSTEEVFVRDPYAPNEPPFPTKLVEKPLMDVADATGGRYYKAEGNDVLQAVFDELARLERTPLKTERFMQKKYSRFAFNVAVGAFFLAAFLLKALFLRRPLK